MTSPNPPPPPPGRPPPLPTGWAVATRSAPIAKRFTHFLRKVHTVYSSEETSTMDAHEILDQRLYDQHMEALLQQEEELEEAEKNPPSTPPVLVRQTHQFVPDVDAYMTTEEENEGSTKRKREEEEENDAPVVAPPEPVVAPPEPEDGIEAGVTMVHPMQAFVPLAIKLDPTTLHPYPKDYCIGSPDDAMPLGGTGMPVHTMFVLDLSPSMCQHYGTQPSGVDALRKLLSDDGLPKWFAEHGQDLGNVSVSIAGFSGTCGWVEDNHCLYQAYLSADSAQRRGHNLHTSTTTEKVLDNVVDANNPTDLKAYCAAWSAKVSKLDCAALSERDQGHGTNTDAAIRFAHAAMEKLCNEKGGVGMVFLCTDGCSTLGHTSASALKGIIDDHTWGDEKPSGDGHPPLYGNRVQTHALMMGNAPNPTVLTQLLGSKGLVAYAPDNDDFQVTLEALLKPTLLAVRDSPGTLDVVSLVTIYDADGKAVSKTEMTWFSQGLLAGDNFTALFGARMPNDFYDRMYNGGYPELDAMRRMYAKVECWMAPSLNSMAQAYAKAKDMGYSLWDEGTLREFARTRGLKPAFVQDLPLHGGTWWSPAYLQRGRLHDRVPIPGAGGRSRIMAFGSPQPKEVGADSDCHTVDPRNTSGLFSWIADKSSILDKLNEELGHARTHAESQTTAAKYADLAVKTGHHGLARRCTALRAASRHIEVDEDVLEEDNFTGMEALRPRRSATSASHYAAAAMSQTTERDE